MCVSIAVMRVLEKSLKLIRKNILVFLQPFFGRIYRLSSLKSIDVSDTAKFSHLEERAESPSKGKGHGRLYGADLVKVEKYLVK